MALDHAGVTNLEAMQQLLASARGAALQVVLELELTLPSATRRFFKRELSLVRAGLAGAGDRAEPRSPVYTRRSRGAPATRRRMPRRRSR